jgi:hypothetical protein
VTVAKEIDLKALRLNVVVPEIPVERLPTTLCAYGSVSSAPATPCSPHVT